MAGDVREYDVREYEDHRILYHSRGKLEVR